MRTLASILVAAALAAASLGAQDDPSPPKRPAAVDVHVLKLTTVSPALVPTAEVVAAKRLTTAAGERAFRVDVGGTRFRVDVQDDGHGGAVIQREAGRSSSLGALNEKTVDVSDPWRWGRRPRYGTTVRGAMLVEPVADATKPFAPLDARGFLQSLVEPLLGPDAQPAAGHPWEQDFTEWMGARSMAARILGSVPPRDYLEPEQIARILAKGAKLPNDQGDRFWQLVRPLIALGHRPTLERLALQGADRGAGTNHGIEPDGGAGDSGIRTPWIPRSVEDSILIAYATAGDPPTRGLAGWIATGTRSNDVYDQLLADIESGRAILPGDASQRQALGSHLVHARAWQSTTAPVLTLAGSALAIAAAMFLLRVALRRLL